MTSPSRQETVRAGKQRRSQAPARPSPLFIGGGIIAAIAIAAVVLFAVPGLLKPASVPPSPDGRISFVRTDAKSGMRTLYVVNPDGANQQQLAADTLIEGGTVWSPDGRYIAAQAGINGTSTIVRVAVGPDNKATEVVQLTSDVKADSAIPAWSPDSKQIAFGSKREGGDFQVFVMNLDGSGKRRLSDGTGQASQPAWSPDGKSIAYVQGANKDSSKEIYVVPVAGGTPKAATNMRLNLVQPLWSRDGKTIVFEQRLGDRAAVIMSVPADGTAQPRSLAEAGAIQYVRMSPTGDKLVYSRVLTENTSGGSDIYVVPLAGGTATSITTNSQEDYIPAWSPDGKKLTWAGVPPQGGAHKIVVANADGTDAKVISTGDGDDFMPLWAAATK